MGLRLVRVRVGVRVRVCVGKGLPHGRPAGRALEHAREQGA